MDFVRNPFDLTKNPFLDPLDASQRLSKVPIEILSTVLEGTKQVNEDIDKDVDQVVADLEENNVEFRHLERAELELKQLQDENEKEKKIALSQISELKKTLVDLNRNLDTGNEKLLQVDLEIAKTEASLDATNEEQKEMVQKKLETEREMIEVSLVLGDLKNLLEGKILTAQEIEKEQEKISSELEIVLSNLSDATEEVSRLETIVKETQQALKMWKQEQINLEDEIENQCDNIREDEEEVKNHEHEIERENKIIAENTKAMQALEKQEADLNKKLANCKDYTVTRKVRCSSKTSTVSREAERQTYRAQIEKVRQLHRNAKEKVDNSRREVKQNQNSIRALQRTIRTNKRCLSQTKKNLGEKKIEIQSATGRLDKKTVELQQQQEAKRAHKTKNNQLLHKKANLTRDGQSLKIEIEKRKVVKEGHERDMSKLEGQKTLLESEAIRVTQEHKTISEKKARLDSGKAEVQRGLRDCSENVKRHNVNLDGLDSALVRTARDLQLCGGRLAQNSAQKTHSVEKKRSLQSQKQQALFGEKAVRVVLEEVQRHNGNPNPKAEKNGLAKFSFS